jgi:hypothetical protein
MYTILYMRNVSNNVHIEYGNVMYCGLSAYQGYHRGEVTYEGVYHYYHDHYCWSIYHNGEVS